MPTTDFLLDGKHIAADLRDLVVAGWTGRDSATVEHHIAELAAIGVARPSTVPCFYRVGINLLTTATHLDFTGSDSSGEAEFILVSLPQGLYVAVGSDHTDRKVESYGVTVSKQMCPKPVSHELWRFTDLNKLPVGTAMYCGTMPLLAEMGPATHFEMELEDPIRGRSLRHGYTARELQYND
jgi:hypothetical protein